MGVKGLNSALNIGPIKGSHKLSSLAGKTLAVDICVWLNQFTKSQPRYCQIQFIGCNEDYVDDLELWLLEILLTVNIDPLLLSNVGLLNKGILVLVVTTYSSILVEILLTVTIEILSVNSLSVKLTQPFCCAYSFVTT